MRSVCVEGARVQGCALRCVDSCDCLWVQKRCSALLAPPGLLLQLSPGACSMWAGPKEAAQLGWPHPFDVRWASVHAAGGLSKEYKTKFRSLVFNLKDANNPDLRARVLQVGLLSWCSVAL